MATVQVLEDAPDYNRRVSERQCIESSHVKCYPEGYRRDI